MKDRDTLDDLFRSKLYDFEADTVSGDWEAIADRLPGKAPIPLRSRLRYWAAAAVLALLMITGGIYMYDKDSIPEPIVQEIEMRSKEIENAVVEERDLLASPVPEKEAPAQIQPAHSSAITQVNQRSYTEKTKTESAQRIALASVYQLNDNEEIKEEVQVADNSGKEMADKEDHSHHQPVIAQSPTLIAEAATSPKQADKRKPSKWGFGMGAGSLAVGSNTVVPQFVTNSSALRSETLMDMNSPYFESDIPKTDIKHKTPISVGFNVSRYLNDRLSLQTGLVYSYLRSEWNTNGIYHGKTKQHLHFLGVPLGVTYRIAEWNRFNLYASGGALAEVNLAGRTNTKLITPLEEIDRIHESVRMKEWMWSVNANVGVSYPLIRFLSAFAEVGASYYFDNGSDIETIRSEKPFNVNLQFGLRLGF